MSLNPRLLNPRSIAVVGASEDTSKTRGKILRCLKDAGFGGTIYPINPGGYDQIQGLKAYGTLADLPEVPDLLLVGIPGAGVPALVEDAARRGCAGAVIFSSDIDVAAMAAAVAVARKHGMSIVGPNTEGFYLPRTSLAATFAHVVEEAIEHGRPARDARRPVAVVSQSGGIGFALFGRALAEHLDLRGVFTTGNEADVEVLDFVEYLVDAGEVGVILLFIEGLKDARRFAAVAEKAAARDVSIVVMKVGRSEAGQRAAISHTAHLAGADTAYDAAFTRHGVIRVFDAEELLAAGAALSLMPPMAGPRVAIVTTSGGAGGWAADLLSAHGLQIPALSDALQQRVMEHLPAYASAGNPVDTTVAAADQQGRGMMNVLEALASSGEVDAVVVNMGLAPKGRVAGMAPRLGPLLRSCGVPVVFHSHMAPSQENLKALADIGAHGFPSFRACAAGLDALRRHGEFRRCRTTASTTVTARVTATPAPLLARGGVLSGVLAEAQTRALLDHYVIPVPPSALASGVDEAMKAAQTMGFPVVLKVQSPDIAHKTEVGGVELHVQADTLAAAFTRLMDNVRRNAPQARIEGVQIQKMMPPGHELVIGVVNDVDFGPLVMLGMGGIYVEVLKDAVFAPAPVSYGEALRMVQGLKAVAILKGARGRPPADVDALARLLVRVSELASDADGIIDQIDFNPVLVYPEGQGVVAVDALIAAAGAQEGSGAHG
jgi:acetyltransferase